MAQVIISNHLTDQLKRLAKVQDLTLGQLIRMICEPAIEAYLAQPIVTELNKVINKLKAKEGGSV